MRKKRRFPFEDDVWLRILQVKMFFHETVNCDSLHKEETSRSAVLKSGYPPFSDVFLNTHKFDFWICV